ncbi:MAG TPA: chromosome segregation protein SMC, partial [Oscillospiraceae bacterium]|nr:chromosome segregation protein SMC [Oscillospiraceae bacterium]
MFLKSLELQGFKSFPDKTRLSFGRGLTAVVGPNGSGKSNISDAVRWVLGEQSTKALRGIRMEDVIFNGSAGRKSYGWAEVRLFLDNTDRLLPIDNDEVVVSRKYYRSGDSEYRIGDKICRLRDVNELFMDTGLGRDGYSLIGQGKIAEIIGAKSTQRREVFEEAAGISKYRYRKEEAERSLVQADENLLRLRDNLSVLEERVGPLKEQSDKAKKFLELAEEKKSLEISVWMRNLRKLKAQLQEQNSSISVFQAEYDSLDADYNRAEEYIGSLYEGIRNLDFDVESERREIAENEAKISGLAADAAVSKNEIQHAEGEIARIGGEIKELEASGSENAAIAEAKQKELAAKESERAALSEKAAANAAGAGAIAEAEAENAAAHAEVSAGLAKAEASIGHISVVLATAGSDAEQYEKRLAEMDAAAAKTGERIAANEKDLSDIAEFLADNAARAESLQNGISGLALKKSLREKQLAALEESRAALQKSADAALSRAKLLQDLEDHMEGFAQSVKFVLERAKAGALRGILAPVSGILSVGSKYSLAVETAISGALQDVVVSDEDAARRAIETLKEQNRGRVTFLPLTSVHGNRLSEDGLDRCEGFVGLGSDLVKYDKKYDGVVLSLLGRIAVVDELGNAVAMAKKYGYRFRIVTLDGQLVNAGGSLTGGSSVKSAGILSRRHEIEELLAGAEADKRRLADGAPEYGRLKEEISALAADSLAAESEL